jgi:hypothetical protein
MVHLIMAMTSHLPDIWSLDVLLVAVVMSVHKAAFRPASNTTFKIQSGLPCEEFCLTVYNAIFSSESQPTFRINMSLPSSGLKNKPT